MTYDGLIEQIKAYLNRNDTSTVDRIPQFLANGEQKICRECKNVGFTKYIVGNFINGQAVYQKPARWKRTLTFNYGTGQNNNTRNQLWLRTYEYARIYWPNSSVVDLPKYYSDYGFDNWLVAPTPNANYPFEVGYLEFPEPLSEFNQQNWLSLYIPDILLYASLLQAMPYVKTDERLPVWEKAYQDGINALNAEDDQRILDRASNRMAD